MYFGKEISLLYTSITISIVVEVGPMINLSSFVVSQCFNSEINFIIQSEIFCWGVGPVIKKFTYDSDSPDKIVYTEGILLILATNAFS